VPPGKDALRWATEIVSNFQVEVSRALARMNELPAGGEGRGDQ